MQWSSAWSGALQCLAGRLPARNSERSSIARLYAFDVHCNSYFPLFIVLYGAQQRRRLVICQPA